MCLYILHDLIIDFISANRMIFLSGIYPLVFQVYIQYYK